MNKDRERCVKSFDKNITRLELKAVNALMWIGLKVNGWLEFMFKKTKGA